MTMCCWSRFGSGVHIGVVATPRPLVVAVVPRGVGVIANPLVKERGVAFRDSLVGVVLPFEGVPTDSLTEGPLLPTSIEVGRRRVEPPLSLAVATPPPRVQAVTGQWEAVCNARGSSGRPSARTSG